MTRSLQQVLLRAVRANLEKRAPAGLIPHHDQERREIATLPIYLPALMSATAFSMNSVIVRLI
jgi:hypothetical protein